jgi:hypothetical protein
MSRAHLFRSLQDAAGNLQRGATVNLYQPGTTTLITATIYADGSTNNPLSQPIACPDGFLSVYFDLPARFRVGVTPYGGGTEVLFEGIDAIQPLQPASETVLAPIAGLTSLDVQSALAELQQTKYGPGNSDPASTSITADRVFYTAYGSVTASEVQHAIQQLTDAKYGPDVPPPASGVTFTPADTIGSTDVQAALVEVEGDIQAHVAQAAGAHAASAVAFTPAAPLVSTTVQAAVTEVETNVQTVQANLTTHTGAAAGAHAASAVSFAPTGDLASTTVQAAIVELDGKRIGTVEEEGTALTQRGTINFIGRRVTATDDAANSRTNITVSQPFVVKTANYTLTATDEIVFMSGANLTATLPTAVGNAGLQYVVKNQDATVLTVGSNGGTIDGDTTRSLAQYDSLTVVSDGTNWGVI